MRQINEIIIHCTATKEGQTVTVTDIDRWHRANGWNGIGYHYVVYLDGSIHKGRNENVSGAHCVGHNNKSLGVVYVGGLDRFGKAKDTRTTAQKMALDRLINELKAKYRGATVHGHNEFAKKDCPCFDVRREYGER